MKNRKFEVRFYWERWISDEEVKRIDCQAEFECEVSTQIAFNGKGIFGIVSQAFAATEKEKYGVSVTVTSVMEMPEGN